MQQVMGPRGQSTGTRASEAKPEVSSDGLAHADWRKGGPGGRRLTFGPRAQANPTASVAPQTACRLVLSAEFTLMQAPQRSASLLTQCAVVSLRPCSEEPLLGALFSVSIKRKITSD